MNWNRSIDLDNVYGDIKVSTEGGSIRLKLPRDEEGYKISAYTNSGSIRTSLPLTVEKGEQFQKASGVVGSGKRFVDLRNESGSIYIRD